MTLNKGKTQSPCPFSEALERALAVRKQGVGITLVGMTKIGLREYAAVKYDPATGRMSGDCADVYVAPEPNIVAQRAAKPVRASRLPWEVASGWSHLRQQVKTALRAVKAGGDINPDILEAGAH